MLRYHDKRVLVTKEVTFDSAHSLKEYDGPCANLHGHTYKLIVGLSGRTDTRGLLVDFKVLKNTMQDVVVGFLDHQNLNDVFEMNTTAENMVVWIFDRLARALNGGDQDIQLEFIRLFETPTSYAEFRREWL